MTATRWHTFPRGSREDAEAFAADLRERIGGEVRVGAYLGGIEAWEVWVSPPRPDVRLHDHGSVVVLVPETDEGRAWVDEHIGPENGWQPWYPAVIAEPRYVADIVAGLTADGLAVGGVG